MNLYRFIQPSDDITFLHGIRTEGLFHRPRNHRLEPPRLNCKENGGKLAMTTKDNESPKLLPCPFCGAEAETSLHCDYDEIIAVVRCTECPAFVRIADDTRDRDPDRVEAEAVAAWNRRAGEETK